MFIQRAHRTTAPDAKNKIDGFLEELMKQRFEKVKISNPFKNWSGDKMGFSFKVSKGLTWTTVKGFVAVDEKFASLDAELGRIARQLVSEEKIRQTINAQFDKLFGVRCE